MPTMAISTTFVAFLLCSNFATASDKIVYGEDDRRDVFDEENSVLMQELARSTAAVIKIEDLKQIQGSWFLDDTTLGNQERLCSDERFFHQPAAARCSSFLVGEDLMISAGHCFISPRSCQTSAFIFDYTYYSRTDTPSLVKPNQVYLCKEILVVTVDARSGRDYAIIQLQKPVTDRSPMVINRHQPVQIESSVAVIGNPSGLPTKIAAGAIVRQIDSDKHYFYTNLDTFEGNSGSPVIDPQTGDVAGILIGGEIDYRSDTRQGCRRVNRCLNDGCRGEVVLKSSAFLGELDAYL